MKERTCYLSSKLNEKIDTHKKEDLINEPNGVIKISATELSILKYFEGSIR